MGYRSVIRIDDNCDQRPSEQLMTDVLTDEIRAGVQLRTAGLRLRRGQLSTLDGPFTETKETIGGFATRSSWPNASRAFTGMNGTSSAKCARWTGGTSAPRHEQDLPANEEN